MPVKKRLKDPNRSITKRDFFSVRGRYGKWVWCGVVALAWTAVSLGGTVLAQNHADRRALANILEGEKQKALRLQAMEEQRNRHLNASTSLTSDSPDVKPS